MHDTQTPKERGSLTLQRALFLVVGLALLACGWAVSGGRAEAQGPGEKQELTAEERSRLRKEARLLNQRGISLYQQGRLVEATKVLEQVLAIQQKVYPPELYPEGHSELATSLNNLGTLLRARGEYAQAEQHLRQALTMGLKLYPKERYPEGHPDL